MSKTDTTLKEVLKTVQGIQEHLHDIDIGMDKDRQNLQNLNVKVAELSEQVEQTRKSVNNIPEKVGNKVANATESVTEATENLTDRIEKSKMVVLKAETRKWWQKLLGIKK